MNNFVCMNEFAEIFVNLTGGVLAFCSKILLIKGVGKLSNLLILFQERHFSAVYGFYSNLYTYCAELLTSLKSNIEYWEKPYNNPDDKPESYFTYEKLLKEKAKKIIDLFKSEKTKFLQNRIMKNCLIIYFKCKKIIKT
ncbi:MAG: hypothetical protein FWD36_03065 [Treponema sp.]|nr:hypothetical protein [Treponema sp.]